MRQNISLEEAQDLLLRHCTPIGAETVFLQDSLGRVLSEDILARENIPPFARSPYDGYAFRAEDTERASPKKPVVLEIIEEVPAGYAPKETVVKGKAVKILTGAPIPQGADAVTKFEETECEGKYVKIFSRFRSRENVVPAGEDIAKDEVIARKGTVVRPPVLGLMASLGVTKVAVYKRPKIAIISTGDELLDFTEPLKPGKIRNSNGYTLAAYCREIGAEPVILKSVRDKAEEVGSAILRGLNEADMVITTGGVSVGDYDVLGEVLN
jgi:molybdopterin molybdotransferase